MATIQRSSFASGWVPSADAVHAPVTALLRMDNCVLDERGVVAVRLGSSKVNSVAFADTDVHSLYTAALSGTRYRMAGASDAVYANGTSIKGSLAGSGDMQFGSFLDQILFARGTATWKYDGSTVRTWGLAPPNAAPTAAVLAADNKVFATFASGESGTFTWADDGTGAGYDTDHAGNANGASVLNPADTGVGSITKLFGSAQDFTTYTGSQVGTDDDIIELYVYITEPQYLQTLTLLVDVNDGSFQKDTYGYIFRFQSDVPSDNTPVVTGWNRLQVRRGDMVRSFNATNGKDWSTVLAVRVTSYGTAGTSIAQLKFDSWRIIGGNQRPLTGTQTYYVVGVYNSGTYTGKSAPSAASTPILTAAQGVEITVGSAVISALDTQINELWLYRENDALGDAYRVAVKTGGPWSGDQTIDDVLSDADALETNLVMERNNTVPPSNIIGIVGPHYDRVLCLTSTMVYPSQPLNLDSCDSTQPVRVGDASETAYWIAKVQEQIYVGTSKDIYRFDGDWTEGPDGLINVVKRPMGVGQPPISGATAQDGDTLLYLAADGWRALGAASPITGGDVDLLYRGYTRHGVSPVNLTGGRFKAAIAKGWLTAITPEGASTTSSTALHRYVTGIQRWYRHTYSQNWRCIYREPDGTLIASDDAGFVWTLDTGTQDAGSDIPVTLWTSVTDDGLPHQRKRLGDARVRVDTGGNAATVALHLNGSDTAATSLSASGSGVTVVSTSAYAAVTPPLQVQFRVTGSFSTFRWYDVKIGYTPFPVPFQGRVPDNTFGTPAPKIITGIRMRACTLGATRTFTPILDGLSQGATFAFASGADEPDDYVYSFTTPQVIANDLAFSVDGPIELYDWTPLIDAVLPLGRTLWDSGPIDLGSRVAWVTHLEVKAKLTSDLTITPYIDDGALAAQTVAAAAGSRITTFTVPLPRAVRGRQARFVVSSTSAFYLYWIEPRYRLTGADTDLKRMRVTVAA